MELLASFLVVMRLVHYNPLAASRQARLDEIDLECRGVADAVILIGSQKPKLRNDEQADFVSTPHYFGYSFGYGRGPFTNKA